MDFKSKRAAALKSAREIVERAKAAGREMTEAEHAEVETFMTEVKSLDRSIEAKALSDSVISLTTADESERKADAGTKAPEAKSLGEHFVKAAGERLRAAKSEGGRWTVAAPEFKAATDVQLVDAGFQDGVLTQYDTTPVEGFRRRMRIADLLSSGTITGNAITYYTEGAFEGDFANVAESTAKPQVHFGDVTPVTESLTKIAAFIKESDEMVEDLPFMVSTINNRLMYHLALFEENQILAGDGTGAALTGLLNRSGIQAKGAGADPAAGNPDTIFGATTDIAQVSGLDADGLIMNPYDYQALRLAKDGNSQYLGGGYFEGQYGNGTMTWQPPIWGLNTVVTPAIAQGTVLVGAFRSACTLYRKGGVRVESTNTDVDDFTNNRVTIRAEERVALAVRRPDALVKITLGTA